MAISSSLYSSISGLSTMGEAMSVLGDNVANVNTVAFKSSRSTFQDVLAQSVSTAAGAAQVGRGVTLSAINSLFAQGSFESSSSPTDMAIGGQGFFMLRAPGSAESDMYSRAGEFGFDQVGNLVNTMGYFVQGWTIDSTTEQRQGAIGDISIGKNTPPVATLKVDVITNLDANKVNETNEDRLFANWDGRNAAATTPTDPIASNKYEYTTAIKIYDSKGASHDLSVYFDRTTKDNQWEFLVTCDPSEDLRTLTLDEQVIYNPDTRYNYENHKGAGALMYGTLQFDTSGNISQIDAFKVPPDAQIDPAKVENRMLLDSGSSYFSLPTNFTGATTNQDVKINLGAVYEGQTTTERQVLVSDAGARAYGAGGDVSNYITSATTWSNVADANGNRITQGDMFIFEGFNNGSDPATKLVYTVDPAKDIQDLLSQIEATFTCTATIDAQGRLKLSDQIAGDSSMFVTRFETVSSTGAAPFGGAYQAVTNGYSITADGITTDGTTAVTDIDEALVGLRGNSSAGMLATGDIFVFTGTDIDGVTITPRVFTVNDNDGFITTEGITEADGLTVVSDPGHDIEALRGTDATGISAGDTFTLTGFDINGAAVATTYTVVAGDTIQDLLDDITVAFEGGTLPAFSVSPGAITKGDGSAVVDPNDSLLAGLRGANATTIEALDTFTFSGTDAGGGAAAGVFTVLATSTVQDLLTAVEGYYGVPAGSAVLDSGKIRVMDEGAVVVMNAAYNDVTGVATGANPFGLTDNAAAAAFTAVAGEVTGVYATLDREGRIQVVDPYNTGNLDVNIAYNTAGVTTANPFGLLDGGGATALATYSGAGGGTLADLITFLDDTYGGVNSGVHTVLDQDGKIRVVDTTQSTDLLVTAAYYKAGGNADPFGLVEGAATDLTQKNSVEGQINFTTSKKMVLSTGRAYSVDTGDTTPIVATTQWDSVFDDNRDPLQNSGLPRGVSDGDSFTFTGTKRDGSSVSSTFTVAYILDDGNPGTIQDLLDKLETDFDAQASIDSAGRLVLTEHVADSVGSTSTLGITSITYPINTNSHDIFGVAGTAFDSIDSDLGSEDGSQQGDVVTVNFAAEALSSTQYANSSTTIFQDQNGFASGFLQSVSTDVDGVITGHYSNGQVLKKAQVALANFSNLAGLSKRGGNIFTETTESGAPVTGAPGTTGLGSIAPNALEQSNVDLGIEFVKLITVQRGFQANSKIITTTDDMLNELINIKR